MIATLCFLFLAAPTATQGRTAVSATLVLKVTDRDKTADTLIGHAERRDGYFSSRTDDEVVLLMPVEHADALVAETERLGLVVDKSFAATDVTARLRELRTRLKSREEVFQRYFSVLHTAGYETVVEVESQMTSLVQEIESLKGSIRLIEHTLQYARVTVRFQFRDRRPPARKGESSFAWLNTVNLVDLFAEFSYVD